MFTRTGKWTFIQAYDCIYDKLSTRETAVYFALQRTATRKNQTRIVKWESFEIGLQQNEIKIVLRDLAAKLDMPTTTLFRTMRQLIFRGFLRELRKSKKTEGGRIIRVADPDEILELFRLRAVRLEQLMANLRREYYRTKSQDTYAKWNKLKQEVEHLRANLKHGYQMTFEDIHKDVGTGSGTLEVIKPILNALETADAVSGNGNEKELDQSNSAHSAPDEVNSRAEASALEKLGPETASNQKYDRQWCAEFAKNRKLAMREGRK